MRKILVLLLVTRFNHEWNVKADGSPKERNNLEDNILYYWNGALWKLTHPLTAICSKDGETRNWLKKLRSLGFLLARSQ